MRLTIVLVFFTLWVSGLGAKGKRQAPSHHNVGELYGNIGRKLAEVKKLAPACAGKISSVLDDVDRMYKATNTSLHQDHATLKELETRTLESAVLQKELLLAKQESENLKQSLQAAQLQVERKHAEVISLKEQNTQLAQKHSSQTDLIAAEISKIDEQLAAGVEKRDGAKPGNASKKEAVAGVSGEIKKDAMLDQNLNLTSTSDPSSPR